MDAPLDEQAFIQNPKLFHILILNYTDVLTYEPHSLLNSEYMEFVFGNTANI